MLVSGESVRQFNLTPFEYFYLPGTSINTVQELIALPVI